MKNTESVNTPMNAVETDRPHSHSNTELTETKPIGKTPFTAYRYEDRWMIAVGKYRTHSDLPSFKACEDYVKNNLWEMIGMFTTVIVETNNQINKEQKK